MKYLITLVLTLTPVMVFADSVACYSNNGKKVYQHHVEDIHYSDDMFIFIEKPSDKLIFTTMDCIVKINV
jgi:hypothetical protein